MNDIDAPDDLGSDLPEIEAAIAHVRKAAREMVAEVLQTEDRLIEARHSMVPVDRPPLEFEDRCRPPHLAAMPRDCLKKLLT